jgi:hypothetical protein
MSRTPKIKELINTRLGSNYGSWIYCEGCNENIGYLCYVTYDDFQLSYQCKCGNCGSIHISFEHQGDSKISDQELVIKKNRLCCPNDEAPLFTLMQKKLNHYKYEVLCTECNTKFTEEYTV